MATRTKAARVLYLGEGFRAIRLRRPFRHLSQRLVLDPECPAKLRGIVAINARDVVVLGGLPGLDVGFHDVAGVAEERTRAQFVQPKQGAEEHAEADQHGDEGSGLQRTPSILE